ncbi:MAG: hypothetical protein AB7R89_23940 [Dehalococcoidia bacterium]
MFFPYFNLTKVNVANLTQTNNAVGQNIAVGSLGVNQALVQVQSNQAAINQA